MLSHNALVVAADGHQRGLPDALTGWRRAGWGQHDALRATFAGQPADARDRVLARLAGLRALSAMRGHARKPLMARPGLPPRNNRKDKGLTV